MSSIRFGLDRKIDKFLDGKLRDMPDVRDKDVDELLRDFADEGRSNSVF